MQKQMGNCKFVAWKSDPETTESIIRKSGFLRELDDLGLEEIIENGGISIEWHPGEWLNISTSEWVCISRTGEPERE